jgi:hypothetical protein
MRTSSSEEHADQVLSTVGGSPFRVIGGACRKCFLEGDVIATAWANEIFRARERSVNHQVMSSA